MAVEAPNTLGPGMAVDAEHPRARAGAQEWLDARFEGLYPDNFSSTFRLLATAPDLRPPTRFREVWIPFERILAVDGTPLLSAEESDATDALIVACDATVPSQVELLRRIVVGVDEMGHDAPPILLMCHTVAPEARASADVAFLEAGPLVDRLLEIGLDGILPGEPDRFELILHVHAFVEKSAATTRAVSFMVNERRSRSERAQLLREYIASILWEYLRARCASSIPVIDYDIPAGRQGLAMPGLEYSQVLGTGSFGTVYKLSPTEPCPDGRGCEVVKVIDKTRLRELTELKCLKRQIDVMTALSNVEFRHPNVIQLYEVYHSTTHIFFRMEYGGPEDLYRRLCHREREGGTAHPLPARTAHAIFTQAVAAVAHLHLGPMVCHRDIKPENFIIEADADDNIVMKLTDFDLAVMQVGGALCRRPCGTVPFLAPEVLLEPEYDAEHADIWSLAVVFLEVHCCVRVVEQALNLPPDANAAGAAAAAAAGVLPPAVRPDIEVAKLIKTGFEVPGAVERILDERCRPELRCLLHGSAPLLTGMLATVPVSRWKAADVLSAVSRIRVDPDPPAAT